MFYQIITRIKTTRFVSGLLILVYNYVLMGVIDMHFS